MSLAGSLIAYQLHLSPGAKGYRDLAQGVSAHARIEAQARFDVHDYVRLAKRLPSRVIDLLEMVPDVRDLPGAVRAPQFQGEVKFDNVSFTYERDLSLLQEIDVRYEFGALLGRPSA